MLPSTAVVDTMTYYDRVAFKIWEHDFFVVGRCKLLVCMKGKRELQMRIGMYKND